MMFMKKRIAALLIAGTALEACGAAQEPPESTSKPLQETPCAESTTCCANWEELKKLDGRRVVVEGIYHPVHVMKGIPPEGMTEEEFEAQRNAEYGEPCTVELRLDSKLRLMLGVYHSAEGVRPDEEIARFKGKSVCVTGEIHQFTPSISDDSEVKQTMIGPYIDVKNIELAE